eukprot:GHVP01069093.1.p1 GENE.GHVP01069093.1~~GHVP01069093.1.p1  ORF type:complete len:1982 (-),score=329.70 GHVP01069093.1:1527-7472(-)
MDIDYDLEDPEADSAFVSLLLKNRPNYISTQRDVVIYEAVQQSYRNLDWDALTIIFAQRIRRMIELDADHCTDVVIDVLSPAETRFTKFIDLICQTLDSNSPIAFVFNVITTAATEPFGDSPKYFLKNLQETSNSRSRCDQVWEGLHVAYRCLTCGTSESSCLCIRCFEDVNHEGHNYFMYRSESGGCCDCGDPNAWRTSGFCHRHRHTNEPGELKNVIPEISSKILGYGVAVVLRRLVFLLFDNNKQYKDDRWIMIPRIVEWLSSLCVVHDALRRFICEELLKPVRRNYQEPSPAVQLLSKLLIRLKKNKKTSNLIKFDDSSDYSDTFPEEDEADKIDDGSYTPSPVSHVSFDEFPEELTCHWPKAKHLYKITIADAILHVIDAPANSNYSSKLTLFLLQAMMDPHFKANFSNTFFKHYPRLTENFFECLEKLCVQFFSVEVELEKLISSEDLIFVIVESLLKILRNSLLDHTTPPRIDVMCPNIANRYYINSLRNVIAIVSNKNIFKKVLQNQVDKKTKSNWKDGFLEILFLTQYTDPHNPREQMIEFDSDSIWHSCVSLQLEISHFLSHLVVTFEYLPTEQIPSHEMFVQLTCEKLRSWCVARYGSYFRELQESEHLIHDIMKIPKRSLCFGSSFYHPLHRFFWILALDYVRRGDKPMSDFFVKFFPPVVQSDSQEPLIYARGNIESLCLHHAQKNTNKYRFNGTSFFREGQFYKHTFWGIHQLYNDLQALRLAACCSNPVKILEYLLEHFEIEGTLRLHVGRWWCGLYTGFLLLITNILAAPQQVYWYNGDLLILRFIHMLILGPRTHSELHEQFPSNQGREIFDEVIKLIAEETPVKENSPALFRLKDKYWEFYDPIWATYTWSEVLQAQDRFSKKLEENPSLLEKWIAASNKATSKNSTLKFERHLKSGFDRFATNKYIRSSAWIMCFRCACSLGLLEVLKKEKYDSIVIENYQDDEEDCDDFSADTLGFESTLLSATFLLLFRLGTLDLLKEKEDKFYSNEPQKQQEILQIKKVSIYTIAPICAGSIKEMVRTNIEIFLPHHEIPRAKISLKFCLLDILLGFLRDEQTITLGVKKELGWLLHVVGDIKPTKKSIKGKLSPNKKKLMMSKFLTSNVSDFIEEGEKIESRESEEYKCMICFENKIENLSSFADLKVVGLPQSPRCRVVDTSDSSSAAALTKLGSPSLIIHPNANSLMFSLKSCGHKVHLSCFERYEDSKSGKSHIKERKCLYCKSIFNTFLQDVLPFQTLQALPDSNLPHPTPSLWESIINFFELISKEIVNLRLLEDSIAQIIQLNPESLDFISQWCNIGSHVPPEHFPAVSVFNKDTSMFPSHPLAVVSKCLSDLIAKEEIKKRPFLDFDHEMSDKDVRIFQILRSKLDELFGIFHFCLKDYILFYSKLVFELLIVRPTVESLEGCSFSSVPIFEAMQSPGTRWSLCCTLILANLHQNNIAQVNTVISYFFFLEVFFLLFTFRKESNSTRGPFLLDNLVFNVSDDLKASDRTEESMELAGICIDEIYWTVPNEPLWCRDAHDPPPVVKEPRYGRCRIPGGSCDKELLENRIKLAKAKDKKFSNSIFSVVSPFLYLDDADQWNQNYHVLPPQQRNREDDCQNSKVRNFENLLNYWEFQKSCDSNSHGYSYGLGDCLDGDQSKEAYVMLGIVPFLRRIIMLFENIKGDSREKNEEKSENVKDDEEKLDFLADSDKLKNHVLNMIQNVNEKYGFRLPLISDLLTSDTSNKTLNDLQNLSIFKTLSEVNLTHNPTYVEIVFPIENEDSCPSFCSPQEVTNFISHILSEEPADCKHLSLALIPVHPFTYPRVSIKVKSPSSSSPSSILDFQIPCISLTGQHITLNLFYPQTAPLPYVFQHLYSHGVLNEIKTSPIGISHASPTQSKCLICGAMLCTGPCCRIKLGNNWLENAQKHIWQCSGNCGLLYNLQTSEVTSLTCQPFNLLVSKKRTLHLDSYGEEDIGLTQEIK